MELTLMNRAEIRPIVADTATRRAGLAALIWLHIAACCVSLIYIADDKIRNTFLTATFHVFFDPARWYIAFSAVAASALFSCVFIIARFSFGYFVGFYAYTMIVGYLWLNSFTDLQYDHRLAGISAAGSAVAFLLPALFISAPVRQIFTMTPRSFDRLLTAILLLGIATIAVGAAYNFRLVGLREMYEYRAKLDTPTAVNYLTTIVSSSLLPFAFAGFVTIRAHWRAAAVLAVLLLFYPVTLTKIALFAPLWLVGVFVLSRCFEARIAVVLSLMVPVVFGLAAITAFPEHAVYYFSMVNFRMVAIPSIAMDVYADFFSSHALTHFCQVSYLRSILDCAYREPLSIVMQNTYKLGYFNASLFATEGIASVGMLWAPVATFMCGIVIAVGNRLSAGLPPQFILISGALLAQILLNVPLSTVLLSHGAGILFLLWYVTPRSLFESGNKADV